MTSWHSKGLNCDATGDLAAAVTTRLANSNGWWEVVVAEGYCAICHCFSRY